MEENKFNLGETLYKRWILLDDAVKDIEILKKEIVELKRIIEQK